MRHQIKNFFVKFILSLMHLEILIILFGIVVGLATYITNGVLLKSLFFLFLGFLGWDFGMRYLNDDDDDDFDGGKMIHLSEST